MNEFNFRVAPRASGSLGPNSGNTTTLIINSFKTKYINGNAGGRTNVAFDDPLSSQVPSWLQISHVWSDAEEAYKVTFKALSTNNTGSTRSFTATFTQWESGKKISYTITQENAGTYEFDYDILSIGSILLFAGSGSSGTIKVTSRLVSGTSYSPVDFEVSGYPSWITLTKSVLTADGKCTLTLKAAENPKPFVRTFTLKLTQAGSEKTFEIDAKQGIEPIETNITLTINWPLNCQTGAFFLDGEIPLKGGAYFSMNILDGKTTHTYQKSTGIRVNMSTAGETTDALPGTQVACYEFNERWYRRGVFTVPSVDTTITL